MIFVLGNTQPVLKQGSQSFSVRSSLARPHGSPNKEGQQLGLAFLEALNLLWVFSDDLIDQQFKPVTGGRSSLSLCCNKLLQRSAGAGVHSFNK